MNGFLVADRYSAFATCLSNDQLMIALYTLSRGLTWIAFAVAGFALIWNYRGGPAAPAQRLLFGGFILLAGLANFTSLLTIFLPIYRLDVLLHVATAAVAGVTAYYQALHALTGRAPWDRYDA